MYRLFFFILPIILLGCKPKIIKTTYPDRKMREEYQVENDSIKHGVYTGYYDNGKIQEKSQYTHGKLSGKREVYDYEGTLDASEIYNEQGELHGTYYTYYPDGKTIMVQKEYVHHKIQGKLKSFYPNGKLKEEVSMHDNDEHGPFVEYYMNGAIHWKGTYRLGPNEYGELFEFDSLGAPIKKMMCDSLAVCRTTWKPETKKK